MADEKDTKAVQDERCQQIITLTESVDATLTEQANTIAEQAAEIERLQAIIDEGGDGGGVEPIPPDTRKPDIYMLPTATGDGSGTSPENAMAYTKLASLVGSIGPDKVIGLIGDKGDWTSVPGTTINKGGQDGAPILIRGTDSAGLPFKTVLKSGRAKPLDFNDLSAFPKGQPGTDSYEIPRDEWTQGTRSGGVTLFTCNSGANWLSFSYLIGQDVSAFAFYGADLMGHVYSKIDLKNVKHGWWMDDDPASGSSVERCIQKMLWEDFTADYFEEDCFRWRGTSHHLEANGFAINSRRCQGHITFGWTIGTGDTARNDTVTDWIIKNGVIRDCHDTHYNKPWCSSVVNGVPQGESYYPAAGKIRNPKEWNGDMPGTDYWNGDGISAERNCDRGLIEDVEISGCTDGAIDCKAGNVTFRRLNVYDNKRNMRLYSPGLVMEECNIGAGIKRGGSGGPAHIYVKGGDASGKKGCELRLDRCVFSGAPSSAFSYESQYKWGIKITGTDTCTFKDGINGTPPPYIP